MLEGKIMSVKWEKSEGNDGVLTVEVDAEKVNQSLDSAFRKVVKEVSVPGFRKGRMPRNLFEKRFGVEALYEEAIDAMLPEAYANAIDESGIEPVDQPDIEIVQIEKDKPFIFKATVTVKPEVILGEYLGIEVEEFDTTVTEEDVDAELEVLQEQFAELAIKEDGNVENGDTVVIDFEGSVDGELFEGGAAENHSLEIGSNSFIPGFEEQLVGVAAGDEVDVNVTFPEEYHAEELAGKDALFKVKVHEIKTKQLPELDDEFAKDVDEEVETLDQLIEKTKERLQEERNQQLDHYKRDVIISKVTENAEIVLPPVMIKAEIDRMKQEFEQNLGMQGATLEQFLQMSGQSESDLEEQMRFDAKDRVLSSLTLEAISKAENIEVSDEEVDKELEGLAEMYNMPLEQIKQVMGSLDGLKMELAIRNTVDFLIENSKSVPPAEVDAEVDEAVEVEADVVEDEVEQDTEESAE